MDPREEAIDVSRLWRGFSTPPPCPRSGMGSATLLTAERFELTFTGRRMDPGPTRLAAYSWGAGPTVYLAHGWGSASSHLAYFVEPLVSHGFRVVAVDAPAHGESAGQHTNIYEFVETALTVIREVGPLHATVGHSLGGASAAIAASRGRATGRLALVSVLARLWGEVSKFAAASGVSPELESELRRYMESYFTPELWKETDLSLLGESVRAPTLFVHDQHDPEVPHTEVEALLESWSSAELHSTSGLGHMATLRDRAVAARVAEYLTS